MAGLPRVIWVLGVASLLNDVSSESIFPLLPVFLTSLGAPMRYAPSSHLPRSAERQRAEQNGRNVSGGFTSRTRPQEGHFRRTKKP